MLSSSGPGAGTGHVWKYGRPSPDGADDVSTSGGSAGRRSSDARRSAELRRPLHHSLQLQHVPQQVASDVRHQHHTVSRANQYTGIYCRYNSRTQVYSSHQRCCTKEVAEGVRTPGSKTERKYIFSPGKWGMHLGLPWKKVGTPFSSPLRITPSYMIHSGYYLLWLSRVCVCVCVSVC